MDTFSSSNVPKDAQIAEPGRSGQQSVANETTVSLRLRRIADLQAEALAKSDALEANLGAVNGAILRIAFRLEEAIEGALANAAVPIDRIEQLAPVIETYLKLTRQTDRFAQLDHRLARRVEHAPKPR